MRKGTERLASYTYAGLSIHRENYIDNSVLAISDSRVFSQHERKSHASFFKLFTRDYIVALRHIKRCKRCPYQFLIDIEWNSRVMQMVQ